MSPALERLARDARGLGARRRLAKSWPTLLFFTDPVRTPDPAAIARRLPPGSGVVFRAFGAASARAQGLELARVVRRRRLVLFVGSDPELARALGADGLHLPERDALRKGRNRALRARFWLSAAAHDEPAIRRATAAGVEALVISPVFPSRSPSAGKPLGPLRFAHLARLSDLPVYALGGVSNSTAKRLRASAAAGLAAIEAFGNVAASRT